MFILGHRGEGVTFRNTPEQERQRLHNGQAPENTLLAFHRALYHGADGFEFDIWRTGDDDLAVVYKNDLSLVVKGQHPHRGTVQDSTMDELRALDVGDGCRIPSLRQVFAFSALRPVKPLINIEAKGPGTAELAIEQIRAFRDETGYPADRIILSSFSHSQIATARACDEKARMGIEFYPTFFGLTQATRIYAGHPNTDRFKAFRPSYIRSVMDTIRPTSIHVEQGNFEKALDCAEDLHLDLVVWTWKEHEPRKYDHVSRIIADHADHPRIVVITDYPAQRVRERQRALGL